ncbi:MAG TPA: hypothetical protein VK150_04855 [Geothrix sp.]|nr:hypothetical protein [Geothrix sp.]
MPDRVVAEEYDALNVPVIPCFRIHRNRSGKVGGVVFEVGWEGIRIVPGEDGAGYKAKIDKNFTLAILADGYCEIPATRRNKERLELVLNPIKHMKLKLKPEKQDDGRGGYREVMVPDLTSEGKAHYTDEVDHIEPPSYRKARSRRQFDAQRDSTVDLVRPWLKQFVSVPGATMLPHPVEA